MPAKDRDQTERDTDDDAGAVVLPPFSEILDALVVGVLFHCVLSSSVLFYSGDRVEIQRRAQMSGNLTARQGDLLALRFAQ